jgi:signal transduction histidine kinase
MTSEKRFPELVSIACHDLRTPLATVYGFSRTLGRLELEAPASRYVEMIDAASDQLGELLDQLSLVTRIESGRYEPALADVDALALAREGSSARIACSSPAREALCAWSRSRRAALSCSWPGRRPGTGAMTRSPSS